MGKPIVYCDGCGLSLREEEFDRGRAVTVHNRSFCEACKPADAPVSRSASGSRIPALGGTPKRGTPALDPFSNRKGSSSRIAIPTPKHGVPAVRKRSNAPWWIGIGGAVLLGVALLAAGTSRSVPGKAPDPAPPPEAATALKKAPPVPEPPKRPAEDPVVARQRQERFLADIEKTIENPRALSRRKDEILGMIQTAEKGGAAAETGRLRALLERRLREESLNQGLVGHWKLDERSGDVAKDSGPLGLDGVLKGSGSWGTGRIGGAIVLDGRGWVEIPARSNLAYLNRGSHTISGWYKPALIPPGKGSANDAHHGIMIRSGMHIGPTFDSEGRIAGTDWEAPRKGSGTWSPPLPVGSFHHFVWAVDRDARQIRLHVNGVQAPPGPLGGQAGLDLGVAPWRIGVGHPEQKEYAWFARGSIDDIRLHERALGPEEAQALFRQAP
jgi:hypothetical protein